MLARRFWDWQLDWQDVTKAPVWSVEHGFGSTGDPKQSSHAIMDGYCVVDGPFGGLEIPYLDEEYHPHCLSRGFVEGEELTNQSIKLSPDYVEGLLDMDKYESLNLGVEHGPHSAIPFSIRGDFALFTAPSGKLRQLAWRHVG